MNIAKIKVAESRREVNSHNATKHGQSIKGQWTTEYLAWTEMKKRCLNKNYRHFDDYGGRGIKICKRWLESFLNFFEDVGRKPSPELQLDRLDNDLGYFKENCAWRTRREQCNNRRSNYWITFNGETKTLEQWSREVKLHSSSISRRIKRGWSVERAMTEPMRKTKCHS